MINDDSSDQVPWYEKDNPYSDLPDEISPDIFTSPHSIYEHLDNIVYGHMEYKKALAFYIYQLKNGHHPAALLVAGESGCGKTEMIRALSKVYRNIIIADGSQITPQGYVGSSKITSSLNYLDFEAIDPPILVLDEADKLICRDGWHGAELTAELLKIMEGGKINIAQDAKLLKYVSTDRMGMILLGSFSSLTDSKQQSFQIGFRTSDAIENAPNKKTLTKEMVLNEITPELKGRIGETIILDPFTQQDYLKILRDERYSPFTKFSNEYNVRFNLRPGTDRRIAHSAFKNMTGVRSMTNEIASHLKEVLFDDPDATDIVM